MDSNVPAGTNVPSDLKDDTTEESEKVGGKLGTKMVREHFEASFVEAKKKASGINGMPMAKSRSRAIIAMENVMGHGVSGTQMAHPGS